MMRARACFNANQARWQGREKLHHLRSADTLADHHRAISIHPVDLKNRLRNIETDRANLAHGRLPSSWFVSTQSPYGTPMPQSGRRPQHQTRRLWLSAQCWFILRLRAYYCAVAARIAARASRYLHNPFGTKSRLGIVGPCAASCRMRTSARRCSVPSSQMHVFEFARRFRQAHRRRNGKVGQGDQVCGYQGGVIRAEIP